jgi:hypothetical protein
MSVVTATIKLTNKKGQLMPRKPRMTKSEKAFVERITSIVFATPEIRNGNRYLDRKTFALLAQETQKRYLDLLSTKTR